jgi:hypothetical protein
MGAASFPKEVGKPENLLAFFLLALKCSEYENRFSKDNLNFLLLLCGNLFNFHDFQKSIREDRFWLALPSTGVIKVKFYYL